MNVPVNVLRKVLAIDAVTCLATGLALTAGADLLAAPLGMPVTLLRGAGLALLPFVMLVAYAARQAEPSRPLLWAVIALNAVWVLDSALLLVSGWVEPTWLGQAFVIAQAAVVALLTELQYTGLRALPAARTAAQYS